MKKRVLKAFVTTMSVFSIVGCSNNAEEHNRMNKNEEYSIYINNGGELSYEKWNKEREVAPFKNNKGEPGDTIKSLKVNENGELMVELTNGQIINAGKVKEE